MGRVRTPVSGQTGWISKHLLANIALVPSLFLRSFPNSYLFFSFFFLYLMMIRLEIIILVRNPQTQHQIWFFFFLHFFFIFSRNLQNRPRVVHRANLARGFFLRLVVSHVFVRETLDERRRRLTNTVRACVLVSCDQRGGKKSRRKTLMKKMKNVESQ